MSSNSLSWLSSQIDSYVEKHPKSVRRRKGDVNWLTPAEQQELIGLEVQERRALLAQASIRARKAQLWATARKREEEASKKDAA